MAKLADLPNLGKVVAAQLKAAGVEMPSQLRRLGSVGAALKLTEAGVDVCSSKLSALEGAIRGVRWHSIPADERADLMRRFRAKREVKKE